MLPNKKDPHGVGAPAGGPCENLPRSVTDLGDSRRPCRACSTGTRPAVIPNSSRYWDLCFTCQRRVMGLTWYPARDLWDFVNTPYGYDEEY